MASTFLKGLMLENFRGIGASAQFIAPFREINFLIGPNNAGKSTVLLFLARYLTGDGKSQNTWQRSFDPLDTNVGRGGSVAFAIAVAKADIHAKAIQKIGAQKEPYISAILDAVSDGDLIWLFPDQSRQALRFKSFDPKVLEKILDQGTWNTVWSALTKKSGGSLVNHWIPETLGNLANLSPVSFPAVKFIPAIREIGAKGAEFTDLSGRGLIDKLAELQNPPHDQRANQKKFEKINEFLREVTDSRDASIEVPYDRRYLLVHMDGKTLPLTSLGTGIHEVIMLAAFCTLVGGEIVCIEEPEIHLHPLLQRKLMRYLRDNTSNQYFVATHSASLIDAVRSSIFRVEQDSDGTKVRLAASPAERYEICKHLGYRASDLLQSNAVVWVEGPSDRIYLNHWIGTLASDLVEGIDYSIMFYGGRLLNHLSANDPDIDEFISLRRLNRNIAIVIDSDKATPHARINDTKKRIVAEFGVVASWVTGGREIENYVPAQLMSEALSELYPDFARVASVDRYAKRLDYISKSGKLVTGNVDKIRLAKAITGKAADLSELDLKDKMRQLIEFIRLANRD